MPTTATTSMESQSYERSDSAPPCSADYKKPLASTIPVITPNVATSMTKLISSLEWLSWHSFLDFCGLSEENIADTLSTLNPTPGLLAISMEEVVNADTVSGM